jgi:hypothetical protein
VGQRSETNVVRRIPLAAYVFGEQEEHEFADRLLTALRLQSHGCGESAEKIDFAFMNLFMKTA